MNYILTIFLFLVSFNAVGWASRTDGKVQIRKRSAVKFSQNHLEEYNEEKQAILSKKRTLLINDIKKFLREAQSEDQKAELNLRLGALYVEEYHFLLAKSQSPAKPGASQVDSSEAMGSLDKAIVIYKDLLSRFPNHPRKDEMLYFMALLNQDRGRIEESITHLQALTKGFPSSKYAAEGHLQIGDYYFDKSNFQEALKHYDLVIARKNPKTQPYAIYKKAWCAFNTHQIKLSLDLFKTVIELESSENQAQLMRLKNEALRDIALPFVELGQAEQAVRFYQDQEPSHSRAGLESLASLFLEKGNYQSAISLNEKLIELDPNGVKNPDREISLITALRLSGAQSPSVSRLFSRAPLYLSGSTWYELHSGSPEAVKSAAERFEETARKYALELHAEGQKTKNDKLYGEARTLYEKYLDLFGSSSYSPTIRFYLAEILYKQNSFLAAADQYYRVYKAPSAGNLRLDSIRYALNALEKEMNLARKKSGLIEVTKTSNQKLKDLEGEPKATPMNPVETKFLEVAEDYLSHFPKTADAADILYQTAYLKYSHYNFPDSYKIFWSIVNKHPGQNSAYSAAFLILDILNRRNEYPKLVQACEKLLGIRAFSKPTFKAEIANILRRSELKRIQALEEDGEFEKAASSYVEYTKTHGNQDEGLLEKALFNASVNYTKANDIPSALEVQERFLRRFPKSSLKETMILQVAKNHESLAHFEKAGIYFEQFAIEFPSNKQAATALRLAALYYWGSRNENKAEKLFKLHVEKYPAEAASVSADLLDLYESQGDLEKQVSYFEGIRKKRGSTYTDVLNATLKMAELRQRQTGELPVSLMEEALKIAQKHSKILMQSPNGAEQMAKTFFWFANQKEQLYYKIKLALPQRNLELSLKRKLALLKEIEKEFSFVAKLGGGDWGLGAIYKTAAAYRALAQDIAQAPVPSELTGEQLDQYRNEIKKQMVIPFSEKALGLVTQCLEKAEEFNLLSDWTPQCYSLGTELNEERYPGVKTFYLSPSRVALIENAASVKTQKGSLSKFEFPFESTALFGSHSNERNIASVPGVSASFLESSGSYQTEKTRTGPGLFNYSILEAQRKELLTGALEASRSDKKPTYSYLYYMRLNDPQKALSLISQSIKSDPNNPALHNLLGLCFLDLGQLTSAKITWLSLLARGIDRAEIHNNLGVLAVTQGNDKQALVHFKAATTKDDSLEALTNLGFMALKYRNGLEAKKHFQKALSVEEDDLSSNVGLGIAQIQNRDFDTAKGTLSDTSSKFGSDPFAKLSLTYLFLDVDKEPAVANQMIEELSRNLFNLDKDLNFRQALQDIRRGKGGPNLSTSPGESLPTLNN